MSKKRLLISELLDHVANEIRKTDRRAKKDDHAVMKFTECEVEVSFDVEIASDGKINLFAVELGAEGKQTTRHRLRVKYIGLPSQEFQAVQRAT